MNEVMIPEVLVEVATREQVSKDTTVMLTGKFAPLFAGIKDCLATSAAVLDGNSEAQRKIARQCRLSLRQERINVESVRKEAKADALRYGKAVDGMANVLKYLCEPEEERLAGIEEYAARQEAARIAAIVGERTQALSLLGCDPSAYNLSVMDDATFEVVLEQAVAVKARKEEEARKAEADRIAKENADRLARKKAEEDAAKARAEAAKAKSDREKIEAQLRAEKEKAAKENAAREEAEEARREAAAKAARAPDKEKILAACAAIMGVPMPTVKSVMAQAVVDELASYRFKTMKYIKAKAGAL